jgi:hypothetical protein
MRQGLTRRRTLELIDVIGAGDKVVVIMRPVSDSGEQVAPVANLTTFRDGKVIEMVHYPNPEDALAAGAADDRNADPAGAGHAGGGTRTPKSASPPAPKAGASTNFATPAVRPGDSRSIDSPPPFGGR